MENELKEKALDILRHPADSKLITHLNACVHCGLCGTSCLFFKTLDDPKYIPGKKVDLVSSLYRRYCTTMGKVAPKLTHARDLDDAMIEEMVDSLYGACTMCGRCVKHCSIGVDIPFIVRTGRRMLATMGMVPKTLQATVDAAVNTGNNMGIPEDEFVDTIQWMEEEMQDEEGFETAEIPLNQENLITLCADKNRFYFMIASCTGEDWVNGPAMWEAIKRAAPVYRELGLENHLAANIHLQGHAVIEDDMEKLTEYFLMMARGEKLSPELKVLTIFSRREFIQVKM